MADANTSGFVQIMVLVALATLSAIVMASIVAATSNGRNGGSLERLVAADAMSISGYIRMQAAMNDPADDLEVAALGHDRLSSVLVGNMPLQLSIEPEDGKLDLLKSDPALLHRYFVNAGLSSDELTSLLNIIQQSRAGADGRQAVDALFAALLDHESVADIEQDFTIYGTQAGIDPLYASFRVLASLPDISQAVASRVSTMSVAERTKAGISSRYFVSGGRHFSLLTRVSWAADEQSDERIPVEVSAAGRFVRLAGAS